MQFKTNVDEMFNLQYSFFANDSEMRKSFNALREDVRTEILSRKIDGLQILEKQILSLYYVDELNIDEIGEVLDIDSLEVIGLLVSIIRKIEYLIIDKFKTY